MKEKSNINGLLLVDKPSGKTSRDIVNEISFLLKTKRVGHTGTLDPLASGLLLILIGKSTKLVDYLTAKDKEYEVSMRLGILTDTLDITGNILNKEDVNLSESKIINVINSFKGSYEQEVPIYSAVKINGKKLYEYARNNEEIKLPKRLVNIYEINDIKIENNDITFRVRVSKGTYIRSLVRDIGVSLNTYGTMTSLRRTKQGSFNIKDAYTLDDIKNNKYKILSNKEILNSTTEIALNEEKFKEVDNGVKQKLNICQDYVCFTYNGELVALYKRVEDNTYKMYVKF